MQFCSNKTLLALVSKFRIGLLLHYIRKEAALKNFCFEMHARRNSSTSSSVIIEEVGDKGVITLNRPMALNALTLEMVRRITPKLREWEKSKSLVIIKGAGEKAFCAGGDVVSITEAGKKGESLIKEFFREEYILNCLIGTFHIPYIAMINGITMGGGVGLSVHGQFRIATEKTLFAMPETAIGLFPDVGTTHFLPRLGGNLGLFLASTGYRLRGRDTLRAGIATHVCDYARLPELESTLLGLHSPYSEDISKVIQEFSDSSTFGKDTKFSLKDVMPKISKCFQGSSVENIIHNLEIDGSEWAKIQIAILNKMSPTSLSITFEALRRGSQLTLQECLAMEYRLTQRCCADHDFYEGVRAVLIDKDNAPNWKPNTLTGITDQVIEKYFSRLSEQEEHEF